MLKITKTRQTTAEFLVVEGNEKKLVKTTIINTGHDAVSTVSETVHDPELYAKHRSEMRKNEQELRLLRYEIEDVVLAELSAMAIEEEE